MDNTKKYVIIIDSFRSHNALVFKCFSHHIVPIHIFSSKQAFEENFSVVSNNYFVKSYINENIDILIDEIDKYKNNILFVFSCSDSGQRLKDQIDNSLNLSNRNSSKFSNERYNKFTLYQTLGQPSSPTEFNNFVKQYNDSIIKPAPVEHSGGCLDVTFVNEHSGNLEDKTNFFISKFFDGEEYAADFVSCEGKHKLVAVWKYVRNNSEKVWKDKVELMHYEENSMLVNSIYKASTTWLDKLEHKFGPVHLEIKHNTGEFFCVEMNFRLNGHMFYGSLAKILEDNQVDLTINCYTTKTKFSGELIQYKSSGYISRVYLMNLYQRKFLDVNWKLIETHSSVDAIYKHAAPWDDLPISNNTYQSSAAIVIMSNVDKNVLDSDEGKVKELFNQRFLANS